MKKTLWILLAVAGLAAAALLVTRAVWRANPDLVSLRVRNAPLAEVIRQLERQSGVTIVADEELTGSVTLELNNVPLADALEQVASQAGGLAGAIHTVYRSDAELRTLKAALASGQAPAQDTWTNLAPSFRLPSFPGIAVDPEHSGALADVGCADSVRVMRPEDLPPDLAQLVARAVKEAVGSNVPAGVEVEVSASARTAPAKDARASQVMMLQLDGSQLKGADLERALKQQLGADEAGVAEAVAGAVASALGGASGGAPQPGIQMRALSAGPVMTIRRSGPGGNGEAETEFWAPERIIMEANLIERLGDALPETPDRAAAEAVAARVRGRCVTLYALKSSPLVHLPGGAWRHAAPGFTGDRLRLRADADGVPDLSRVTEEVEARIKRENLEQFQKLTPEQRAERARARVASPSDR